MVNVEKNQSFSLREHSVNEIKNEGLQFPGYLKYSPKEDIFRKGKRFNENLEGAYDRLKNNNTGISSRLRITSVSDHLELVAEHNESPTDFIGEDASKLTRSAS
ncbi:MAG: hypothetical protein ABI663_05250 [Chryseolinea sp.]